MIQVELYLPPPITPQEAASIIGRIGGRVRAERIRLPIRTKAQELRRELGLPEDPRLSA